MNETTHEPEWLVERKLALAAKKELDDFNRVEGQAMLDRANAVNRAR
jgi:hypothetical protein